MNIATPTLEDVKRDYHEVVSIFMNVRDIETLKEYQKRYKTTIEVDRMPIDEFISGTAEIVRIETWNSLGYIYFNYTNPQKVHIMFDVYSEDVDEYFIDSATYETLEEEYIKGLLWIISLKNQRIDLMGDFIKDLKINTKGD